MKIYYLAINCFLFWKKQNTVILTACPAAQERTTRHYTAVPTRRSILETAVHVALRAGCKTCVVHPLPLSQPVGRRCLSSHRYHTAQHGERHHGGRWQSGADTGTSKETGAKWEGAGHAWMDMASGYLAATLIFHREKHNIF